MAVNQTVFAPSAEGTSGLSVVATTARRQIQAASSGVTPHGTARYVRAYNAGANDVFLAFGGPTVAATLPTNAEISGGSLPLKAGDTAVFACPHQYVAAIAAVAGPTQIWLTPGELVRG